MSVLVEFAMFPTDKGESVSSYVSRVIDVIDRSGFEYKLTPMGTVFETESMEDALNLLNECYKTLDKDCNRIYATVKFDIRKNRSNRMKQKIESIERKLKKEVKK